MQRFSPFFSRGRKIKCSRRKTSRQCLVHVRKVIMSSCTKYETELIGLILLLICFNVRSGFTGDLNDVDYDFQSIFLREHKFSCRKVFGRTENILLAIGNALQKIAERVGLKIQSHGTREVFPATWKIDDVQRVCQRSCKCPDRLTFSNSQLSTLAPWVSLKFSPYPRKIFSRQKFYLSWAEESRRVKLLFNK